MDSLLDLREIVVIYGDQPRSKCDLCFSDANLFQKNRLHQLYVSILLSIIFHLCQLFLINHPSLLKKKAT